MAAAAVVGMACLEAQEEDGGRRGVHVVDWIHGCLMLFFIGWNLRLMGEIKMRVTFYAGMASFIGGGEDFSFFSLSFTMESFLFLFSAHEDLFSLF